MNILSRSFWVPTVIVIMASQAIPYLSAAAQSPSPFTSDVQSAAPGRTDFNVRDRLAITNLIHAYSLAYDNYHVDAWIDLFTPHAVFAVGWPGVMAQVMSRDTLHQRAPKWVDAFKAAGNRRRHLMSNIVFLDQGYNTAHVSIVGMLANIGNGNIMTPVTTLNYEGWLVKRSGVWKIERWYDFPDSDPGVDLSH